MKYTPEFYQKAHDLDALLVKALEEEDTPGKRRTLGHAFRLLTKYNEQISDYLKKPEPVPQPSRMFAGMPVARVTWLYNGLRKLRALKSEIERAG